MGLNPSAFYWMEIFSQIFVVKIVMFVCEDKNKLKRGMGWPFLKMSQCNNRCHMTLKQTAQEANDN